ncbi:MAG TPA: NAD(P)/FAD-dependent oxidoreductase [Dehalococcoidia bacterium]|nr:NAD(P)/FAD-dependent oxidoreductase [Dehalococcoidia bacterium]
MDDRADAVIVGGSVAGAATAAFLARRGRRVVVLERARFPRDKPCGEGIMPHGVDVLAELGLARALREAGAREVHGVRYTLPDGRSASASFSKRIGGSQVALGLRRLALDELLARQVAALPGVDFVQGVRVCGLRRAPDAVVALGDGGQTWRGRVLVGADGLHSRVRAWLGWDGGRRRPRRYGVVGHFRLRAGELPPLIDVLIAPGLEAYLTPLDRGDALVALLGGESLMRRFAGRLHDAFAAIVAEQPVLGARLRGAELLPGVRATGPFAARARRVAGSRALLVGDAAGFLDPITGEGMASALVQARAAAGVIDRALRRGERPNLSEFSDLHRSITRQGAVLTWLALALCASPALSSRAMCGLQRRPGLFGRLLAINSSRAALSSLTPRDWLALLTGI